MVEMINRSLIKSVMKLYPAARTLLVLLLLCTAAHAGMYDNLSPEARRLKAATALENGKNINVLQYLSGMDDRESSLMRARAAYAEGQFKLAAIDFKHYLRMSESKISDPKEKLFYVFALKHLVNSYYMVDNFISAQEEGNKLIAIDPTPENKALLEAIRQKPMNTSGDTIRGDDVEVALLGYFEPHGYGDVIIALKEDRYQDILILLHNNEKPEARLLRGFAYYGLDQFSQAATEMEAGREVFLSFDTRAVIGNGNISGSSVTTFSQGKLLKIIVLRQLMMAYYKSDDLDSSLNVAKELAKLEANSKLSMFTVKLQREISSSENQITESTSHFKIIYDGYEHGTVNRLVLSVLEDAYRDIGQKMDHYPSVPITVVLHTKQNFHDVTRSPQWTGGVFMDGRIRIPVVGVEQFDSADLRRILYHEYVHAVIFSLSQKCSRWMHEGLAEYYSRGQYNFSKGPSIAPDLIDVYLQSGNTPTVTLGYSESRNTIKVLMDNYNLYSIKQYLSFMKEGKTSAEAFKGAFFLSYNEFMDKYGRKR